jgi:cyclophilin family peptidyl-prolyl cis-trans isomerase
MKTRTVPPIIYLLACLLSMLECASVFSQPMQPNQGRTIIEFEPKTPEFQAATDAFRAHLFQMVENELRFHNSDNQEEEKRYRSQWYELREQGFELYQSMLSAALDEFQADPQGKQALAEILFGALKRNVENDLYEGMLPIAQALDRVEFPAPELTAILAMCCLAENEFELARQPLEKLIATGSAPDELLRIYEELDSLTAAWQDELVRRERDAQGEPLPLASLETTKGTIVIELFENDAPEAVANFISLAEKGFYNYNAFFMVLSNLMAQTGCPKSDGSGGPGYFIPRESEEFTPRKLFRGSVSLALLEDMPDSGGSQFMIAYLPLSLLSEQSTVFGRVISGMPNVAKLNRIDPNEKKEEGEPPVVPDEILSVEILRKRDHKYEPTRLAQPYRDGAAPKQSP